MRNPPATTLPPPERTAAAEAPWQVALREGVRDPMELLQLLRLDADLIDGAEAASRQFPLRVPRAFVARMRPGDPTDPLLRQVLPLAVETRARPGFGTDPVGELSALARSEGDAAAPGVLHKYAGRALLVTTGACAVHCRYCFRRHFPYGEANPATGDWEAALTWLQRHPELDEVILSGGDPLVLPDDRLAMLAGRLAEIPHLRRLRVHTRLPVVLPERVDAALLHWLTGTRLQPVLVVHANHPREVDDAVRAALARLRAAGVTLLNQAVLLRGVNDDAETLAALSTVLFDAGVLPYYLHLLDPVAGAAHFDVPDGEARALMAALRDRLPGYLVPRLVREVPGEPAKRPL